MEFSFGEENSGGHSSSDSSLSERLTHKRVMLSSGQSLNASLLATKDFIKVNDCKYSDSYKCFPYKLVL